jgi:hypothetical protein
MTSAEFQSVIQPLLQQSVTCICDTLSFGIGLILAVIVASSWKV